MSTDGGFLDRWSRRKRRAEAPEAEPAEAGPGAPSPPEAVAAPGAEAEAAFPPEATDAEILETLGLPDPDRMQPGDDFSAFMRGAVPRRLRNRALRRLWASNPVLACLDGLNDYEEDFTDAAKVMPGLKTAYKVGRGMLDQMSATLPDTAADTAPDPEDRAAAPDAHTPVDPPEPPRVTRAAPLDAPQSGDAQPGTGAAPAAPDAESAPLLALDTDAAAHPSARRSAMRFRFAPDCSNTS
ncbi:DUF3306 domain-containing protein [Paroceanicella profunda]|uniref:DUF3306 domain-containing protein n=1 Tax=Paroceanicella profunda TaxID=2579971 RepID=A0A5B8FHP9_9RHOB|nr:DUF3306 domain-containing protein [Paroceanicella profunda]QDL92437.1 DUF3306 domain-containing protein [Paroceanicella profunda]